MRPTSLMLPTVVFVAVLSVVFCAPYPGDDEDLANRPFHLLQKRPTVGNTGSSGGKNKGKIPSGTSTIDLNNFGGNTKIRVGGTSNVRFSSNFSNFNSRFGNTDINLKDICKSCPSTASGCKIVKESKGKELLTTTKCMNGSKVISETTKTSPNPSGAMIRSTQSASVQSHSFSS